MDFFFAGFSETPSPPFLASPAAASAASSGATAAAAAAAGGGIFASVLPVSGSTRCVSPEVRPRARTEEPVFRKRGFEGRKRSR